MIFALFRGKLSEISREIPEGVTLRGENVAKTATAKQLIGFAGDTGYALSEIKNAFHDFDDIPAIKEQVKESLAKMGYGRRLGKRRLMLVDLMVDLYIGGNLTTEGGTRDSLELQYQIQFRRVVADLMTQFAGYPNLLRKLFRECETFWSGGRRAFWRLLIGIAAELAVVRYFTERGYAAALASEDMDKYGVDVVVYSKDRSCAIPIQVKVRSDRAVSESDLSYGLQGDKSARAGLLRAIHGMEINVPGGFLLIIPIRIGDEDTLYTHYGRFTNAGKAFMTEQLISDMGERLVGYIENP